MTEVLLFRGARIEDSVTADLLVEDGAIVDLGSGLSRAGATIVDVDGLVVLPGLVDLHTHLREPGREDAETVETGTLAAALGGYTAVHAMANTDPVADSAGVVEQVWLAGRDAGGSMALRLALQYSLPVAGAASLGGALPRGGCLLAHADRARRVPIMLMCARESQIYPSAQVADDLRLLHAAGCKLAIREYLCGDELFTDMFNDLDQWMMQLVCGTPSAATV